MENEKRKSVRVKKQLQVSYSRDGKLWDVTAIRDFSELGMQIAAVGEFSAQETIYLRVVIPFRPFDPLKITGQVVGTADFTAGFGASVTNMRIVRIAFVGLDEAQKERLQEYIQWSIDKDGRAK